MEFIAGFIAGELRAAEARAFETHLGACPDCAAFLHAYKKTVEITRAFLRGAAAAATPPLALPRR